MTIAKSVAKPIAGAAGLLATIVLLATSPLHADWSRAELPLAEPTTVEVYRSASCGCCKKWIEHLRSHGFTIEDHTTEQMASIKAEAGVPQQLASCHTAKVGGYVIEGHVPADDIKRLLAAKPDIDGLSVPGMPVGSPGMEQGAHKQDFGVLGFKRDGSYGLFNVHSDY